MAAVSTPPIRFRGPPSGLTALLVGSGELPEAFPVTLNLPDEKDVELEAEVTPYEGRARLYLTLPPSTPPGRYSGRSRLAKNDRPIVADVEAEPELDVEPGSVRVTARAGEKVELELTLYNAGNVPIDLRGAYVFGLFPDEGAERAILRSHEAKADGSRRLDILVDSLADEFAGTVRVRVAAGRGAIERRDAREIRATLVMPKGLQPGRSYDGTWEFEGFNCYVRVDVPQERIG
jgi:hypothetical protein